MRPVIVSRCVPVRPWPYLASCAAGWRWEYGYPPYPQFTWSPPPLADDSSPKSAGKGDRQQPLTFVLVHGSWADSGYWDGTAKELRSLGHIVHAPEYAGHRADTADAVSHAIMTRSIADFIVAERLRDIVLVGHGFGGTLVQKTAELIPERIKRLVFLNAFVLKDGESVADQFPSAAPESFERLRQSSEHDAIMLPFPLFREAFANLASLETARQLYEKLRPEPAQPLFERLELQLFDGLNLPKSYVHLTEDNVWPHGGAYGWHPHMSGRLGLFRLIRGSGDHMSTAVTEPGRLAGLLYAAGRD